MTTGTASVLWAATPRGPLYLDNGAWVSPTTSLHLNAISAGSNTDEVLFAVRSVGVWKQTAGGVIGNSSLGIEELPARSVDADPTNPLGIALAVQSGISGGVFTTNDTVTWQLEPLPPGKFRDVVYAPDGTLYAICSGPDNIGAKTGVYRRDASTGWEHIGPDAPIAVGSEFGVLHLAEDPSLLLLGGHTSPATGRRAVIWRSVNAGATWSLNYEGQAQEEVTDIEEVLDGQGQNFVASFTQPGSQLAGAVLRSSNAGQSWTRIALGPPQGSSGQAVASDPLTPTNLYLGDTTFQQERLFRSSDGGVSWNTVPGSEGANGLDFHPLSDTTLFATSPTAPAVRRSEDAGLSFVPFDSGLDEAGSVTDFVVDDNANFAYLTTTRGLWFRPLSDVVRYCAAAGNSVGLGAGMDWAGSTSASSADLELFCNDLPSVQPGLFFHGPAQFNLPFGNGRRCVGAGDGLVVRLPIVTSDAGGMSSYRLSAADYASIPPASTRFFQYWYRDPAGGGSFFNLSDALAIRFGL